MLLVFLYAYSSCPRFCRDSGTAKFMTVSASLVAEIAATNDCTLQGHSDNSFVFVRTTKEALDRRHMNPAIMPWIADGNSRVACK